MQSASLGPKRLQADVYKDCRSVIELLALVANPFSLQAFQLLRRAMLDILSLDVFGFDMLPFGESLWKVRNCKC